MDIQKEKDLLQEAFEVVTDEMGFCLDQKWGDYENPYENSDTALAFNLFKKRWQAKSQAVPEKTCSIQGHEIIINETKNELINDYDIAKEDEYLLEALVYRGVCIGKSQAVPDWKDYTQQSPRIDGRYQIFINGEQLAADWKSPFGFADPIEGVALIQDLITHWAVLSADPVIVEQSHEH